MAYWFLSAIFHWDWNQYIAFPCIIWFCQVSSNECLQRLQKWTKKVPSNKFKETKWKTRIEDESLIPRAIISNVFYLSFAPLMFSSYQGCISTSLHQSMHWWDCWNTEIWLNHSIGTEEPHRSHFISLQLSLLNMHTSYN